MRNGRARVTTGNGAFFGMGPKGRRPARLLHNASHCSSLNTPLMYPRVHCCSLGYCKGDFYMKKATERGESIAGKLKKRRTRGTDARGTRDKCTGHMFPKIRSKVENGGAVFPTIMAPKNNDPFCPLPLSFLLVFLCPSVRFFFFHRLMKSKCVALGK